MTSWREWSRGTWVIIAGLTGLAGGTTAYVIYKSKKKEPEKIPEKTPDPKTQDTKTQDAKDLDTKESCAQALEALPKEIMYTKGTSTTSPYIKSKSLYDFAKMDLESKTGDPAELIATADTIRRAIDNGYYDSDGNLVKIDPKHAVAEKCLRDMAAKLEPKFTLPKFELPKLGGEHIRVNGKVIPATRVGAMFMSSAPAGIPAGRRKFGTSADWERGFAAGYADCKRGLAPRTRVSGIPDPGQVPMLVGTPDWRSGYKAGWAKCEKEKPVFSLTTSAEYNSGRKAGYEFCEKWNADPTRRDKSAGHVVAYVLKGKSEEYKKGFYVGKEDCEKKRLKGPPVFNEEYEAGRAVGFKLCAKDKARWDYFMGSSISVPRRDHGATYTDHERGFMDALYAAGCIDYREWARYSGKEYKTSFLVRLFG